MQSPKETKSRAKISAITVFRNFKQIHDKADLPAQIHNQERDEKVQKGTEKEKKTETASIGCRFGRCRPRWRR